MAKTKKLTLENGLECLFSSRPALGKPPKFCIHLLVKSGSASDPRSKKGLAHVVEHIFAKEELTYDFMFSSELKRAKAAGETGNLRAKTEFDYSRYGFQTLIPTYKDAFELLRRWHDSTVVSKETVNRAKAEVIFEKHEHFKNSPFTRAYDELYRLAYKDHPYASYPTGKITHVRNLKFEDCLEFYSRHYAPENLLLSCFAALPPELRFEDVVSEGSRILSGLRAANSPCLPEEQVSSPDFQNSLRSKVLPKSSSSKLLLIGFKSPPFSDPISSGFSVLHHLMLGPTSSLRRSLKNHCAALTGVIPRTRGNGLYEILVLMNDKTGVPGPDSVLKAIFDECNAIKAGSFSDSDLQMAKQSALQEWEKYRNGPPIWELEKLALHEMMGRGMEGYENEKREIQDCDREQIMRLSLDIFREDRATVICEW